MLARGPRYTGYLPIDVQDLTPAGILYINVQ